LRKNKHNKVSLFNVLISLFLAAAVLVLLVYNIIHVNSLAYEINNSRTELGKQININNALQTEIERLSTYDNIKPVATEKLKLNNLLIKPKRIIVNKSNLDNSKQ
jgi:cell division protein FtsL